MSKQKTPTPYVEHVDEENGIKWHQFNNSYGTLMTDIECLQTGRYCSSNEFGINQVGGRALKRTVEWLRAA